MKKMLLLVLVLGHFTFVSRAQWSNTGNNHTTGKLGIGVPSPQTRLSVYGSAADSWNSGIELNREGGGQARFVVNSSGLLFRTFAGSGHFYFRNKSDNTILTLTNEGNVGIGTINPGAKLEISDVDYAAGNPMFAVNHTAVAYTANENVLENSRPFLIRRYSNNSESFATFLSDNYLNFVYKNDEAWNAIHFRMVNTDTETGGGAQANDNVVMTLRGGLDGGRVGIGTVSPAAGYRLAVNGKVRAKEIVVDTGWSDFVFEDGYKLRSLQETETFIKEHKHLPDIPSEKEVLENGVGLGEINSKLLQKIEELTLYMIEMEKGQAQVREENRQLRQRLEVLEAAGQK